MPNKKSNDIDVKINKVKLTISIVGKDGKPVPDCLGNYHIHGGFELGWQSMGPGGQVTFELYATTVPSYADIKGKYNGKEFQTSHQIRLTTNTNVKFLFVE